MIPDDIGRIFGEKDIWREMAARVLDKPESDVTREERSRAKQAFFLALYEVSELPENEHLAAALKKANESATPREGE